MKTVQQFDDYCIHQASHQVIDSLYKDYYNEAFQFASRILPTNCYLAGDALSEVYEGLRKNPSEIISRSERGAKAYFFGCVRNWCMTYYRKKKREKLGLERLIKYFNQQSFTEQPVSEREAPLIGTKEPSWFLNQLTKRERQVYEPYLEGKTRKEIANKLGMSYDAVKKSVNRAEHRLKSLRSEIW